MRTRIYCIPREPDSYIVYINGIGWVVPMAEGWASRSVYIGWGEQILRLACCEITADLGDLAQLLGIIPERVPHDSHNCHYAPRLNRRAFGHNHPVSHTGIRWWSKLVF